METLSRIVRDLKKRPFFQKEEDQQSWLRQRKPWIRGVLHPGPGFISEEAEAAYKRRARRVADVIQLKVPDRVPIVPSFGMFPALDNGFTCEEVMFEYEKASEAWLKTLKDFTPDLYRPSAYAFPGRALEALDYKLLKLPGRGIPSNHVFQFVEEEYVKAEDFYDAFLQDPSDFMLRSYLPRVCGALAPFKGFPPFYTWFGYYLGLVGNVASLAMPEIAGALEALQKAAAEALKWLTHVREEMQTITPWGFPDILGGHSRRAFRRDRGLVQRNPRHHARHVPISG